MRTIHKFLISLLLSIVLLGVFIVVGYTGLFETIETKFYNQRIIENKRERIEQVNSGFHEYNDLNISRFSFLLDSSAFQKVFELNQNANDIQERKNIIGALEDELIGFQYLRIVDYNTDIQKIHFSSDADDIKSASSSRIIYNLWRNSDDFSDLITSRDNKDNLVLSSSTNSIIYRISVKDSIGLEKGIALIYFSTSGFKQFLFSQGLSSSNSLVQLLGEKSLILDLKQEQLEEVSEKLLEIQKRDTNNPHLISENVESDRFFLLNKKFDDDSFLPGLNISIVIKESELQLNPALIVVLLILSFSIFFLIFFIFLNIHQDRSIIIASRIKKFQLNFLINYLDDKSDLNWEIWEREMRSRREQVRKEFKKGLGRFKEDEEAQIDELIDSNWDEIITVLSKKKEVKNENSEFNLAKIEQILQKALKNVNFTVGAEALNSLTEAGHRSTIQSQEYSDKKIKGPIEVEELSDDEDFDDLEELGDPIEVEELSGDEDFDDLEELGDPIEVEELSDYEDFDDLEELGDPIEVEELSSDEDFDDLEELGDPIEVEELSDDEDFDDLEELGDPIEVEELSDDEDFDDLVNLHERVLKEDPENNIEELLSIPEFEELPLIVEEELESIPIFNESEEALLMDINEKNNPLDVIDILDLSVMKDESGYYSKVGELEEIKRYATEKEILEKQNVELAVEDIKDFDDLEVLDDLEDPDELEDLEELEELGELEDFEELDDQIYTVQSESYFTEVIFSSFIKGIEEIPHNINIETSDSLKRVSSVQNHIEKEVDFVHVYSDDLLPQFLSDEKDEKGIDKVENISKFSAIEGGFDFDSYASSRKDEYKALIGITREINAVGGIIYISGADTYEVELSLGIGQDLISRLKNLLLQEEINDIALRRNIIYIQNTFHEKLKSFILEADRRFLKSCLFIPVYYEKKQAYLFLGFKKEIKNIEKLLNSIN